MARRNSNLSLRFRCGLHLRKNRLAYQTGERPNQTPMEAELPECHRTEAFDPRFGGENGARSRL